MLESEFQMGPMKWESAAQPFIDHHPKRILITCYACFALKLLRCDIAHGANHFLQTGERRTRCNDSQTKITEEDLAVLPEQHILRLDVAMNHLVVMGIL